MSPSPVLFNDLFFSYVFSEPTAVDHRTGIGIVSFLITAADADGMGDLAGRGESTVVIVDKEVTGISADFTAA